MKTPSNGYEDWYKVRAHEIDGLKKLTLPALMMLMQEASMDNALELKISIWDKEMENLSWVILRKEISVFRFPTLGEKIRVITYPAGFQRIFAYRDFRVYDEAGEVLAHASSTWTLMDLESRKVSKIPQSVLDLGLPDEGNRLPIPQVKIPQPAQYNGAYEYRIRHYDLDWNNHVNNIIFTKLMMQAVPAKVFNTMMVSKYTIHIKAECYHDELVSMSISQDGEHSYSHKMSGHDGRTVALGKSEWVEKI